MRSWLKLNGYIWFNTWHTDYNSLYCASISTEWEWNLSRDFFHLYMQIVALIVFNCNSRIRLISSLDISHILSICFIFSCFLQSGAVMVILIQIHCIGKCDKTEYTCRIVVFITDVSSQNTSKQSQISRWQYADKEYKISFGEDCFYS